MALSRKGQSDEDCLHVFYRIDAAWPEMVHEKIPPRDVPIYKTLETAILFPLATTSLESPAPGKPSELLQATNPPLANDDHFLFR